MILFNENKNEYEFCTYKINYTHNGETVERYVGPEGIDWWKEFEKDWDTMKINSISQVTPTKQQEARLEELKSLGIKGYFPNEVAYYVEKGSIDNENCIALKEFSLVLENRELKTKLKVLEEQGAFRDDLIQEMATIVYGGLEALPKQ